MARVEAAPSLGPGAGLDSAQWAQNELGDAPLGDERLSARLAGSATLLVSCPGHAFSGTPDRAAMKGYYRPIDHPDESQVTPEHIVAPHRARTLLRMRTHDTVLCIQDGTDSSFATGPGCEGLSIIGRNRTSAKTRGLHLHLTLAVSGAGLPLGVLRCGFDAPIRRQDFSRARPAERRRGGLMHSQRFDRRGDVAGAWASAARSPRCGTRPDGAIGALDAPRYGRDLEG